MCWFWCHQVCWWGIVAFCNEWSGQRRSMITSTVQIGTDNRGATSNSMKWEHNIIVEQRKTRGFEGRSQEVPETSFPIQKENAWSHQEIPFLLGGFEWSFTEIIRFESPQRLQKSKPRFLPYSISFYRESCLLPAERVDEECLISAFSRSLRVYFPPMLRFSASNDCN